MNPRLEKFIETHIDLIEHPDKESYNALYSGLELMGLTSEYTKMSLDVLGIDPAMILGFVPSQYLAWSDIQHYSIPTNATMIDSLAFKHCLKLEEIIVPSGVKKICSSAFEGCRHLKKVVIEEGTEKIFTYAFGDCRRLTFLKLPSTIQYIGYDAFSLCFSLREIRFNGTMKQAQECDIAHPERNLWLSTTYIKMIICTDGVIEL